ncbi:hypothetical protein THAR02_09520 [Trichoderma harzianum]|uniref:Uncharacterized protein n=1 Tax=Trichoderma harzianum TaxID=5544 RepID=A0A0F9X111_TRIHA|nr:hypothetical protein THAR02_09520 [Trichoderma harzianum]
MSRKARAAGKPGDEQQIDLRRFGLFLPYARARKEDKDKGEGEEEEEEEEQQEEEGDGCVEANVRAKGEAKAGDGTYVRVVGTGQATGSRERLARMMPSEGPRIRMDE